MLHCGQQLCGLCKAVEPYEKKKQMLFLRDKQNVLVPSQNRVETTGLDPKLICGSFGLCLNPYLPFLGPRHGQRLLQTQRCVSPVPTAGVTVGQTRPHSSRRCSGHQLCPEQGDCSWLSQQGLDSPSIPSHPHPHPHPQLLGWPLHKHH